MKKPPNYQELVIRREHYIQLLRSGRVKPKAHPVIRSQIGKLTHVIAQQWPN